MSRTVRTTLRPWEEIEIGDAEYLDLLRQGLIAAAPSTAPSDTTPVPAVAEPAADAALED